eukprot:2289339-Rhodomonas_salina.6
MTGQLASDYNGAASIFGSAALIFAFIASIVGGNAPIFGLGADFFEFFLGGNRIPLTELGVYRRMPDREYEDRVPEEYQLQHLTVPVRSAPVPLYA